MHRLPAIALLALLRCSLSAQRGFSGARFSGASVPVRSGGFGHGFNRGGGSYVPLYDSLFGNYVSSEYPAAQPPVIVEQPQAAPAASSRAPAQPLTIELRGDRYVQISGDNESRAEMIDQPELNSQTPEKRAGPPARRVVLIFRDGHREEVSNYTVTDGFLYAGSDYYTAGTWVRKVAVSDLNVAETVAANESQGAAFRLPGAANEVVVGP